MCGICGFIEKNDQRTPARKQILEQMMTSLYHRGPDQGKSFISPHAALGFRRLSIIDLAGSEQPMVNETGEKVLLFNGEIYNYKELRKELQAAGHRFLSLGDSEVLLHGYEEWGEQLPEHLRGMFAFVLWDEQKQQLYAARDPFGIKPFYYTVSNGSLIFASEIKAILCHPAYEKRLNEEALEQYLTFQYSVLEETFFKGIFQLLPGHFLTFAPGKVPVLTRYFLPELTPKASEKRTSKKEKAWVEQLDQAVLDSVDAHMASDVEIGAFLSGGVDSCLIAAEYTGQRTFTVGFGNRINTYNEIPLAKKLAETLHLSHQGKQISEREFWDAVPEVLYHMDEPSGDPSAVALYFLAREAARNVKVVVSGEGADELFGGYRIYCEPNALHRYQKLPLTLRKKAARLARHLPSIKGRSFLIRGSLPVEERFIGNAHLFTEEERKQLLKHPTSALAPDALLAKDYQAVKHLDEASRMQYIDLLHWLPGDILQKADRMSMAHSLELRVPYLDQKVFETARSLPARYKQKGQVSKYLFRKVARHHLPKQNSKRRKLGFPVPLGSFLHSKIGRRKIEHMFYSPAAEHFFHQETLTKLLTKPKGRFTNRKIWAIYTFLVWYHIYFPQSEVQAIPKQVRCADSA